MKDFRHWLNQDPSSVLTLIVAGLFILGWYQH